MVTARLVVEPLGTQLSPWRAGELVAGDARPFVLAGDWAGGSRVLAGSCPVEEVVDTGPGDGVDPFGVVDRLPVVAGRSPQAASGAVGASGPVGGGWVAVLGFALGERLHPLGPRPVRPAPLPEADLARYDHVVRCDGSGRWWLEALVEPGREAAIRHRFAQLRQRARDLAPADTPDCSDARRHGGHWDAVPPWPEHGKAVAAALERIGDGDVFEVNIAARLEAGGPVADLWPVFSAGVRRLAPAKAAWVRGPGWEVAGLSPETFLRRTGRTVVTSPIKGTRPRADADTDPLTSPAVADLRSCAKDAAEHLMVVDLARSDLARVAVPGSVGVRALAVARTGPGVWHLVSDVVAELPPGTGDGDVLRATFPPASVTGTPKIAALRTIAELETTAREVYCGAVGLVSPLAGLDLNVAIRTLERAGERAWLGVGGGIVAESTPAGEVAEAHAKAAPLLRLAGAG